MQTTFMNLRNIGLALTLAVAMTAAGCGGKKTVEDELVPTAADADENRGGDSDSGNAMGLQTVNYPYDSFVLDTRAKGILTANAGILKANSGMKVQIEGHCDERGGIQYNLALGEKRASAARKFLMDLGISGNRITTISFGKERPLDSSSNEDAWAKNRRANFVITSR